MSVQEVSKVVPKSAWRLALGLHIRLDLLVIYGMTIAMKTTARTDAVCFSVKGQVVIPRWLRKEYQIEKGTRAMVYPEGDHIALKPVTPRFIRSLRGSLKGTGAWKAFLEERKKERAL